MMVNWEERGWKQIQPNTWYSAVYCDSLSEDFKHLIQCNRLIFETSTLRIKDRSFTTGTIFLRLRSCIWICILYTELTD